MRIDTGRSRPGPLAVAGAATVPQRMLRRAHGTAPRAAQSARARSRAVAAAWHEPCSTRATEPISSGPARPTPPLLSPMTSPAVLHAVPRPAERDALAVAREIAAQFESTAAERDRR